MATTDRTPHPWSRNGASTLREPGPPVPQPAAGPMPVNSHLSYAQRHERVCVRCGSAEPPLVSAGHLAVDGLVWAVSACPEHVGVLA